MSSEADPNAIDTQAHLPDFCAPRTVLVVILIAELAAIVLTLASGPAPGGFFIDLARTSMFVLWFALLGSALLCQLRDGLERTGTRLAFVLSFCVLLLLAIVLAEVAWQINVRFGAGLLIESHHNAYVGRTFAISAILIALTMRYLYVASEWRRSILLEAEARISALQALIRPHFLFNSMNTIAALTRSDPRQAEQAVEDLSDLLRANLRATEDRSSLGQEIETAKIYQRIEALRLGDRLRVHWALDGVPMDARIPSLTLQPLLENAIYHGIERLPDGGDVSIEASAEGDEVCIRIANPVPAGESSHEGNRIALDNIRQRFELAYEGAGSVDIEDSEREFAVTLRFPLREAAA